MVDLNRTITVGKRGSDVAALQQFLLNQNVINGSNSYDLGKSAADGSFGKNSRSAWLKFEKDARKQEIIDLQTFLKNAGFNPGASDGIMGPKTRAALKKYKKAYPNVITPKITIVVDGKASKAELHKYVAPKVDDQNISKIDNKPDVEEIDPNEILNKLKTGARKNSKKLCAKYVRVALDAGGLELNQTNLAKDYGPKLEEANFEQVAKCKKASSNESYSIVDENNQQYSPQPGDVAIIKAPGHHKGHMQMYWEDPTNNTNGKWISDFVQNDFSPYKDHSINRAECAIYRHPAFDNSIPADNEILLEPTLNYDRRKTESIQVNLPPVIDTTTSKTASLPITTKNS